MKLITDANLITEAKTDERTGEVYIEGILCKRSLTAISGSTRLTS